VSSSIIKSQVVALSLFLATVGVAPPCGAEESGQRTPAATSNPGGGTTVDVSTEKKGGRASEQVNLSSEQRAKIHALVVGERSAPHVAHVDFDVKVGTVVPREQVKLLPLPTTIVEIEPTWRGYEYFLVGDEIVVVDPATLRIVAVLPS